MLRQPAKIRWAWYGACAGITVAFLDLLLGPGSVSSVPFGSESTLYNFGLFFGAVLGGAVIGLVAGSISDAIAWRTGRVMRDNQ